MLIAATGADLAPANAARHSLERTAATDAPVAARADGDAVSPENAGQKSVAPLNADMTDKIKDAKHWRVRSADIRARAAEMQDGVSRRVMLSIAENYEFLAERAEEITDRSDKTGQED
jgi:hypothetical protein